MAFGVGLMTPVPYPIAYALIGGLSTDSIVKHPEALKIFPEVKLIDFDTATKDALEKTHPAHIERVWVTGRDYGSLQTSVVWSTLKHEGCFIDHREMKIASSPETIFQNITQLIATYGWQAEIDETRSRVITKQHQRFGDQWIEWRIDQTHLTQTSFFSPRGLPGFIYWYFLMPFHNIQLNSLAKNLTRQIAG